MEWMHPKTSSQSSLFESTVNETCMVQKCTRALDCPWCGRWKPPGENCDLWMKLAHGMGTQIIWELKQRLKQDLCCLTCSLWTIHLDICFNLFSPVRLPTEGGGFYWHVLKGLRSELLSTALCSLWKAWRITASCCGLCFSFWHGSPTDLMVWFLPPQPPHSCCWSGLSVTSWATRSYVGDSGRGANQKLDLNWKSNWRWN